MTNLVKQNCTLNNPSLVSEEYLMKMEKYIKEAKKSILKLSFNPYKIRSIWKENYKAAFCNENPSNAVYCQDTPVKNPENFSDYLINVLPHISMSQKVNFCNFSLKTLLLIRLTKISYKNFF